jgi:hypothetical protein
MLGRNHILFNLSTFFPLLFYLFLINYPLIYIYASFLCIIAFSNFPDIDIKYRRGKILNRIIYLIFYFPFIILALILKNKKMIKHRGITHTVYGLILFSFIVSLIYYSISFYLPSIFDFLILFSIIFSYILHLLCDLITAEGIVLTKRRFKGILITGKNDSIYTYIYSFFQIISTFILYRINFLLIPTIAFLILISFILIPLTIKNLK